MDYSSKKKEENNNKSLIKEKIIKENCEKLNRKLLA